MKQRDSASQFGIGFLFGVIIGALAVLAFVPNAAIAATPPPCQAVAGDVTQIPNGVEHFTMLHATAHTTACTARTWTQISVTIQQLQPDGSWSDIATATSPAKYVSPFCRTFGCKSASVVVDRDPCISGTFRALAAGGNTALPPSVNVGPAATLVCYGDA